MTTLVPSFLDESSSFLQITRPTINARMSLNFGKIPSQGFSWTEIYFRHFVQSAPILFGHLEIF